MAIFKKTPKQVDDNSFAKINRVKPLTNVLLSLFFTIMAIGTVVPVLLANWVVTKIDDESSMF